MQLATITATAATAPTPAPTAGFQRPPVWPSDKPGVGLGRDWIDGPGSGVRIGTEFGRGMHGQPVPLSNGAARDLYYEALDDAVFAARSLSSGEFRGAISLNHDNFVGAQLRQVRVQDGGIGEQEPAYHFEAMAQTQRGRRELERTLKLDHAHMVVDGEWTAVADGGGNVRLRPTTDVLAELRGEGAPAAATA